MAKDKIKAKIQRYDPEKDQKPYFQEYVVEIDRELTVHELLTKIHKNYDGTLAYRAYKCFKGMCTTCIVKLDGKTVRSCATRVEPGSEITIEPAGGGALVRDLVVDFKKM